MAVTRMELTMNFLCKHCLGKIQAKLSGYYPKQFMAYCMTCNLGPQPFSMPQSDGSWTAFEYAAVIYVDFERTSFVSFPPHNLLMERQLNRHRSIYRRLHEV